MVTIVDGGETLVTCLTALANQQAHPHEIIVPYDDTAASDARLASRFPTVRFLPLGALDTGHPTSSYSGLHELYDRRRSAGLAAASGDLIAILEDRSIPRPEWTQRAIDLHQRLPHAVIGGAITNGRDLTGNWAVYFCDFGRYQPPFLAGLRAYVSDVNVCYKRRALEATKELWKDRYHETTVHWALRRGGETLFLSPELVVDQMRRPVRLGQLLRERVGWGRVFGYTRAREAGVLRRVLLVAAAPVLPVMLFARLVRLQLTKRETLRPFVRSAPLVGLLLVAWALGEAWGYITGTP